MNSQYTTEPRSTIHMPWLWAKVLHVGRPKSLRLIADEYECFRYEHCSGELVVETLPRSQLKKLLVTMAIAHGSVCGLRSCKTCAGGWSGSWSHCRHRSRGWRAWPLQSSVACGHGTKQIILLMQFLVAKQRKSLTMEYYCLMHGADYSGTSAGSGSKSFVRG